MAANADSYALGRDFSGSVRLDAQHLLWKLINGYTINPEIPISPDMKVAEIGCGTGLWLMDLASQLPQTAQLDGYDVSGDQFPNKEFLPANMTLNTLDAFDDVPESLVEKYDVVHLRFWCCIVKGNDPTKLIRHAAALLKTGGYLQWEDAHLGKTVILGNEAEAFGVAARAIYKAFDLDYDWLGDLSDHVASARLSVLQYKTGTVAPSLTPLMTNTYLAGHVELFQSATMLKDSVVPTSADCFRLLSSLVAATKTGAQYHWRPINLLAKKDAETIV